MPAFAPLADDLWTLAAPLVIGPIRMDHRMTVARLADDQLWVHSPVEYSREVGRALEALGRPAHFVAPSTYHDLYWKEWFAAYPQARFYAAPGVGDEHPDLPFTDVLGPEPPAAWDGAFEQVIAGGMPKINEVAFFHQKSDAAILADLAFNYDYTEGFNLPTRLTLKMFGTYNRRCSVSRLLRKFVEDKAALRRSIDEILAWKFSRLIVGHGRPLEDGASELLGRAYAFLKP